MRRMGVSKSRVTRAFKAYQAHPPKKARPTFMAIAMAAKFRKRSAKSPIKARTVSKTSGI